MSEGEMCVYCGENTEYHRNPFGLLATSVYRVPLVSNYFRGKQGIIDLIIQECNQVAHTLLYDDKQRDLLQPHMSKTARATMIGEINAYNRLLSYLNNDRTFILSEAEYDRQFPALSASGITH